MPDGAEAGSLTRTGARSGGGGVAGAVANGGRLSICRTEEKSDAEYEGE